MSDVPAVPHHRSYMADNILKVQETLLQTYSERCILTDGPLISFIGKYSLPNQESSDMSSSLPFICSPSVIGTEELSPTPSTKTQACELPLPRLYTFPRTTCIDASCARSYVLVEVISH